MPCKNKLGASNLSWIFYVVWGFLGRTVLTYEHVTTMVIKILLTTLCKIDHNYSGRNVHPQCHICRSMSSVGQVSWTRSRNVSLGQLQSHYATMIQITKNSNNMIINAHISMCSNRAYQLRIEMALIPLMGSKHGKQKFSYAWTQTSQENSTRWWQRRTNPRRPEAGITFPHKHCRWRLDEDTHSRRSRSLDVVDVVVNLS
jgi:hypothetical protein